MHDPAMTAALHRLAHEFREAERLFREPYQDQVEAWLADVQGAVQFTPEDVTTMRRLLLSYERPERLQ